MSAPQINLSFVRVPKIMKVDTFDEVQTKTILHSFLGHGVDG